MASGVSAVGGGGDCPSDLLIIVAALRGELPLYDRARAGPEVAERIRAVVEADLARVDALAARNTDADAALYYERTQARLQRALATLAAGPEAEARVRPVAPVATAPGPSKKRAASKSSSARVGAADSARVRVQTQAAGAALLGVA